MTVRINPDFYRTPSFDLNGSRFLAEISRLQQAVLVPKPKYTGGGYNQSKIEQLLQSFLRGRKLTPDIAKDLAKQWGEAWNVAQYYDAPQSEYNFRDFAKRIVTKWDHTIPYPIKNGHGEPDEIYGPGDGVLDDTECSSAYFEFNGQKQYLFDVA
jgi:hypothetical protein